MTYFYIYLVSVILSLLVGKWYNKRLDKWDEIYSFPTFAAFVPIFNAFLILIMVLVNIVDFVINFYFEHEDEGLLSKILTPFRKLDDWVQNKD